MYIYIYIYGERERTKMKHLKISSFLIKFCSFSVSIDQNLRILMYPTKAWTLTHWIHQRNHQSSASLAFVWGIHRGPVNSPHKWPVTRKMFPFDDVIMDSDRILRLRGCDTVSSSMEILRYHLIPMWNIYAFPMYIIDIWHKLFIDLRLEFRFNFMSKISNIGSTI